MTLGATTATFYVMQHASLLLTGVAEDLEVDIVAKSIGETNETCLLSLAIKAADDLTGIYGIDIPPAHRRLPAPALLTYWLDDIAVGGQLTYSVEASSNLESDIMVSSPVNIDNTQKAVYDKFYPIDQYSSMRVHRTATSYSLSIESCDVMGMGSTISISCKQRMALGAFGTVSMEEFYRGKDGVSTLTAFAYVNKNESTKLKASYIPFFG